MLPVWGAGHIQKRHIVLARAMIVDVLPVPGGPCSNLSHLTLSGENRRPVKRQAQANTAWAPHMCGNVFFAIILSIIRMMSLRGPVAMVHKASQITLETGDGAPRAPQADPAMTVGTFPPEFVSPHELPRYVHSTAVAEV